jgi:hypothetical protein
MATRSPTDNLHEAVGGLLVSRSASGSNKRTFSVIGAVSMREDVKVMGVTFWRGLPRSAGVRLYPELTRDEGQIINGIYGCTHLKRNEK